MPGRPEPRPCHSLAVSAGRRRSLGAARAGNFKLNSLFRVNAAAPSPIRGPGAPRAGDGHSHGRLPPPPATPGPGRRARAGPAAVKTVARFHRLSRSRSVSG